MLFRSSADEIIAAALRYQNDPNRAPTYTPHPTTWLNQDRWDDDPLPPRNANGQGPNHEENVRRIAARMGVQP